MKKAFTMAEVMVAMLVAGIVLTAIMSSFLSVQFMMSTAMAESEMAVAARSMREKLLFCVSPPINGVHYAGMLSGTNTGWIVETGSGNVLMQMKALGNSLSDPRAQSMRLVLWQSGANRFLLNEHTPNKDAYAGWLWPGRIPLVDTAMSDVVSYDAYSAASTSAEDVYRVNLDVNMKVDGPRQKPIFHREHISVPLLGRRQPMMDSSGRY